MRTLTKPSPLFRSSIVAGVAVASVLVFAGCAPEDPAPTSSTSPSPSTSASAPSESSAPSAPPAGSTPVGVTCDQLLTPDEIYAFNPNFSLVSGFTPESGTDAAAAVAAQGIACGYVNQTSGEMIVIAVALPGETELAAIESGLSSSTPVDVFGAPGWFTAPTAEVISGAYWLTASSEYFYEAADAQQLVSAALGHLG